ncbi:MAG: Na(+)-translocating NADH-quinone reductase subunit A [Dysgonamonadaceae bacterium]|nr:Na(+)-translocating NADH-quinone reductase subunit A [Dysgonamonadaceae bacterium]
MTIKIKKGLDIKIAGKPQPIKGEVVSSAEYTVYPDDFAGFVSKVYVHQGDKIKAGSALLYDKNHPDLKITSPVSGEVVAVNRGEKRRLISIVVKSDEKNDTEKFDTATAETPEETKALLAQAGLFAFIRQRPYDIIANYNDTPRDIFITCFSSAPLASDTDFVIQGQEDDFQTGIDTLARLTNGNVYLGLSKNNKADCLLNVKNAVVTVFDGPHPAGNVGVQINKIKPVNKGETVWTTDFQSVVYIGRLINKGIADFTRLVALTGSEVKPNERRYYTCLPGVALGDFLKSRLTADTASLRIISGNVLTGKITGTDGSLHYCDNQITVIPEGTNTNEFFGWISPGLNKYSVANSFASRFLDIFRRKEYRFDARIKGGKRAMIMSEEWDKVFPMDILPEYILRAIIAFDIEKMENLGIYEVAPEDFALCEFVDTSKMELQQIVREGLDKLYKEMV